MHIIYYETCGMLEYLTNKRIEQRSSWFLYGTYSLQEHEILLVHL